jgi:hypothetical protein
MLVPRMAAARIHGPDAGRHGESDVAERMAASSQGGFIWIRMPRSERRFGRISGVCRWAGEDARRSIINVRGE